MEWIREIQKLKQVEAVTIREQVLLNRFYWPFYIASVVFAIYYLLMFIYDANFRFGAFYSFIVLFCVIPIYALQRKETEKELKKITEIFKPSKENIDLLLNIIAMGLISTIIFVTLMVIPGIEKAATATVATREAVIIELSPELRLKIEWWMHEALSNIFLTSHGEELLCGLFVVIGYKLIKTARDLPKAIAVTMTLTQVWTLLHIWWKPYVTYIICLAILRAILTLLYFLPIKIGETKLRETLLSAIMAHSINNLFSVLVQAGILSP